MAMQAESPKPGAAAFPKARPAAVRTRAVPATFWRLTALSWVLLDPLLLLFRSLSPSPTWIFNASPSAPWLIHSAPAGPTPSQEQGPREVFSSKGNWLITLSTEDFQVRDPRVKRGSFA